MKKFGIIFFELALIILLFACTINTQGLEHYKVKEHEIHVAWDPPQNIPKGSEIRYCVYICKSESKDRTEAVPVGKPIAETSCTVTDTEFPEPGVYFIGVQTVALGENGDVVCDPKIQSTENRSNIAWSDKEIYTNYHPFDVRYGQK